MRRLVVSWTLAVVSIGAVGCGDGRSPTAPAPLALSAVNTSPRSEPAPTNAARQFEIDFLQDMIDHHAMAVMMAELCVEKGVRPELASLCEQIQAAQSQEIVQMQAWLQDWYGITHEPEMMPGAMKMMERMASLDVASFEVEFMEMMIRHHRKAVVEGEMCIRRAYHEELRELCEAIVEAQTAEIALMQSWLCQWYGRCRGGTA